MSLCEHTNPELHAGSHPSLRNAKLGFKVSGPIHRDCFRVQVPSQRGIQRYSILTMTGGNWFQWYINGIFLVFYEDDSQHRPKTHTEIPYYLTINGGDDGAHTKHVILS